MNNLQVPRFAFKSLGLLIFLAGMLPVMFHCGTAGLFETSEGRYASVARRMLDSGDWLTPRHNGLRHFTKPPVTYWFAAAGMKIFGINEFGARFFLSIAAGATALATWYLGKLLFCRVTGLIASLVLISSIYFQTQFRGLTTDPFLAAFETLMALAFFAWLSRQKKRWYFTFWLATAAAMLTKGPPGLLPLAGLIPAALLTGHRLQLKKLFGTAAGWAIFVIFGLGWYLLVAFMNPGLLSYFLIDETVKRVASDAHQRSAPFFYFLILLPAGIFPWTGYLLMALKDQIGRFRKSCSATFMLLWVGVPLLIFTLSRSKLAGYTLPLLVPLALLTAQMLRQTLLRANPVTTRLRYFAGLAIVVGIAGAALIIAGYQRLDEFKNIAQIAIFSGVFWLFAAAFLGWFVHKGHRVGAIAVSCLLVPGLMFFVLPGLHGNEAYANNRYLTSQWRLLKRVATLPAAQKIICIDKMIEGWYFYTGRDVITWDVERNTGFDKEATAALVLNGDDALRRAVDNDTMLVMPEKHFERVKAILDCDLETLTGEGNWRVAIPRRKTGY